jgi:DNA processing protein
MDAPHTLRPGDGRYPSLLAQICDRPEVLHLRGDLGGRRTVAVVGSRETDGYGEELARSIAGGLARAGVTVVSGGARGVDGVAHRAALEAGGHTVAVLGTGVDMLYPAQHRALLTDVLAAGGALVSEQPHGTPALQRNFPARNRIISGLSEVVVVVRAGEKSGALITASWARSQGRPVLAVPGDARDPLSAGTHGLLRAGARLVTSAAEVLAEMGLAQAQSQRSLPDLSCEGSVILSALSRKPRHAGELAEAAGLKAGEALAGLLVLELEGLCEQRPGHYFLRREGI